MVHHHVQVMPRQRCRAEILQPQAAFDQVELDSLLMLIKQS
jgi:hypothetical protein